MRLKRGVLLGALLLGLTPGAASAYGYVHGGSWAGWAAWWPAPSVYTQEHVPYFAKHPPVYYSRPIARPYGYLPYPYVPAATLAQPAAPRPVAVRNPYASEEATPAPRRIVNPFAQEPEAPDAGPDEVPLLEPEA